MARSVLLATLAVGVQLPSRNAAATEVSQLLGSSPGFYGAMKPLRFGMTRAEVRASAPFMTALGKAQREPVIYGADFDRQGRLERVDIHFLQPQRGILAGLAGAWGEGRRCSSERTPGIAPQQARVWLAADGAMTIRASIDGVGRPTSLTFIPARPVIRLNPIQVVRRAAATAARRLGPKVSQKPYGGSVQLPGPPYTDGVGVSWRARAGRVVHMTLALNVTNCIEAHSGIDVAIRRWASKQQPSPPVMAVGRYGWRIRIDTPDRQ